MELKLIQLEELVENLPCGAAIYEIDGRNVTAKFLNKRYLDMVGRDVNSSGGVAALDYVREDDRAYLMQIIGETIYHGRKCECDIHIINGSGEYNLFHLTGSVASEKDGVFTVYATYTPRSEEEHTIREVIPIVLKTMLASSTDLSFVKDKELRYVCSSRAFAQMTGCRDENEIVGKTDYDLFDRELAEKYRDDDIKLMEEGESLIDYIESLPSDDGTIRYSCTSKYLLRDQNDKILGIYGVGRDVTEDRAAYAKLKLLTDSIPGGIAIYEFSKNSERCVYVSEGMCLLTEYNMEEYDQMIRENAFCCVYEEDREGIRQKIAELIRTGEPQEAVYRIRTKSGNCRWMSIRGAIADRREDKVIINGVITDITKERNTQLKLRASNRAIDIASDNIGISFWMLKLNERSIVHEPLTKKSQLGYGTTINNVPESMEGGIYSGDKDREDFVKLHERIYSGEKSCECTIRVMNYNTNKYEWRHMIYTRLSDDIFYEPVAIGFSCNVDLEQENRLRYEQERKLRKELIKNSIYYYQLNLTTQIIEEYFSKTNDLDIHAGDELNDELGRVMLSKVVDEDRNIVKNTIFSQALKESYNRGETQVQLVYRRILPGIGVRWIEASCSLMENKELGEIVAFIHSKIIDTEKKDMLAIEAIMGEEIESLAVINIKSGLAHLVQLVSELGGLSTHESFYFDSKFQEIVKNQVLDEDQNICKRYFSIEGLVGLLEDEEIAKIAYRIYDEYGNVKYMNSRAFYLDDTREEIVMIRRDMTDIYIEELRRQQVLEDAYNDARAANRAKSEFLSRMSHDMRTPLNAVLAFSSNEMTKEVEEEELREYVDKIHTSGEYLLGIINDVLDMAKIEQKKIVLNKSEYTFDEFKNTINTIIGESCKQKDIDFEFSTPNFKSNTIMVDKVRFNQIFINLLSNAVKFTPEGGKVECIIDGGLDVKDSIVVEHCIIRDNGVGMSKDFVPHAFESFAQEYHKELADKIQGTGLGLSIVKELVTLMGGTIEVESEIGVGTTFTMNLPVELVDDDDSERNKEIDMNLLNGAKILLCEDNYINTEIAVTLLEKKGCIVECASNGMEGFEMFSRSPIDYYSLILMDIRMPVMDGHDATRAIRREGRPDAKIIPIIAMTADAFNEDRQISKEAGMTAYITKPIEPDNMYETIVRQL